MNENPILIETSFADAIAIIAAASELPEQTRKHWPSSMRQSRRVIARSEPTSWGCIMCRPD